MRARLTLLGLLACASAAWASEIRLANGLVHRNVKILSRDETNLQLRVSNGVITLPIAEVEAIDGAKVVHPAPVAPDPAPVEESLPPALRAPLAHGNLVVGLLGGEFALGRHAALGRA